MPKNIALFIDGTWNEPLVGERVRENTNVWKLHRATRVDASGGQVKHYLRGVGTDVWELRGQPVDARPSRARRALERVLAHVPRPVRNGLGGAFGWGTRDRIKEAYQFLSSEYDHRRGDHVFLFGFSRGAFAARSLAGFVDAVGILLRDHARMEHVEEAYALYESGADPAQSRLREFLKKMTGAERPDPERGTTLPIYFLGVWDTVGALGLPRRMKVLSAPFTEHHQTGLPANVTHARHALALHELRRDFEPLPWTGPNPANPNQTLEQVWFPGAHADVGGGYAQSGLSDMALDWMVREAVMDGTGLQLDALPRQPAGPVAARPLHHQVRGVFALSKPEARGVLLHPDRLDPRTVTTFRMHRVACERFLSGEAGQYRFLRDGVNRKLAEVDELSLRLHLRLSFERGIVPVDVGGSTMRQEPAVDEEPRTDDWWAGVRVDAVAGARGIVRAFVDALGAPSDEQRREFAQALCLQVLCEGERVLDDLWERVEDINRRKSVLLVPKHPELSGFTTWLARFRAIVEGVEHGVLLMPPHWRDAMRRIGEVLRMRYAKLNSQAIAAAMRAHLRASLEGRTASFRKLKDAPEPAARDDQPGDKPT